MAYPGATLTGSGWVVPNITGGIVQLSADGTSLVSGDGNIGPTLYTRSQSLPECVLLGSNTNIWIDAGVVLTNSGTNQHTMFRTGNAEFSAVASPIPGVSIYCADEQDAGDGTMRYTSGTTSLAWRSPGDAAYGPEVNISGVTNAATVAIFKLVCASATKSIYVYVAPATRSTVERTVKVAGVTGAKAVTWSRTSNVTTVTEAGHQRRVGDFAILFNDTTAMRHGYISAVSASTWTIADAGSNASGSARAYGVRNIRIQGNGAVLDYNKNGLATGLMSNLQAIIMHACSDVSVKNLQVNNCTKYGLQVCGYTNVEVDGLTSWRTASTDLSGNSDLLHVCGPGRNIRANALRAQAGDNIVGVGCGDYMDYQLQPIGFDLSLIGGRVTDTWCEDADQHPVRFYNANGSNIIRQWVIDTTLGTYSAATDGCVAIITDNAAEQIGAGNTHIDGLLVIAPDAERADGTRSSAFVCRGTGTRRNIKLQRVRPRLGDPATIKSTVSIESSVENLWVEFDETATFSGYCVGILTGATVGDLDVFAPQIAADNAGFAGFPVLVGLEAPTATVTRARITFSGDDVSASGQKLIGLYNQGVLGRASFTNCTMVDGDSLYRATAVSTAGPVLEAVNTKVTTGFGFATEILPASIELTNFSHLGGSGALLHNSAASGTIKVKASNVIASNRFLRNVSGNSVYQINVRQLEAVTVLATDAGTPSWRVQSSCDFSVDGALLDATVANHGAGASFYNTNAGFGAGVGAYVRGSTTWVRVAS